MNLLQRIWPAILLFTCICTVSPAQYSTENDDLVVKNVAPGLETSRQAYTNDVITKKDEANIKSKAERVVNRFMGTLNAIATGIYLEVPETEKIIQQSFSFPQSKQTSK